MKAISIKQPWASLIAHNIKNIENRTWKTNFRGTVYIHACAEPKIKAEIYSVLNQEQWEEVNDNVSLNEYNPYNLQFSAVIGEVEIVDCVINHESIWAEKTQNVYKKPSIKDKNFRGYKEALKMYQENKPIYNWVLANPILYEKPILNVKGKLSFWEYKR